jgi:hypothetical protein
MLAKVLLTCLNAFLIFWTLEAIYVVWLAYRNNALPSFGRSLTRSGKVIIKRNIVERRADREQVWRWLPQHFRHPVR